MKEYKEKLFLAYIDGTLDSVQMAELEQFLAENPGAREELLDMKEIADCQMPDDMTSYDKERRTSQLINAITGGKSIARLHFVQLFRYLAVAACAAAIGLFGSILLKPASSEELTALEVGPGGTGSLTLPDGTKVTVKSCSAFQYDASTFHGKRERTVRLDGEAFFEVAPKDGVPFIVETERENVRVLGTSFNLQAYGADDASTLVLLDGKVSLDLLDEAGSRVHSLEIHPGERCVYEKQTGEVNVEKVSRGEASQDWKSGTYYFRGETLPRIVSRLEQYYGVSIELDPGLKTLGGYSGALSLADGLEQVLSLLDYDNAFTVVRREKGYYLLRGKE